MGGIRIGLALHVDSWSKKIGEAVLPGSVMVISVGPEIRAD
jgi:hypothetical protein